MVPVGVPETQQGRAGALEQSFARWFLFHSPLFSPELEAWGWDVKCSVLLGTAGDQGGGCWSHVPALHCPEPRSAAPFPPCAALGRGAREAGRDLMFHKAFFPDCPGDVFVL